MKTWGSTARRSSWSGTFNFYTADDRFTNLIKHPEKFLDTGCHYAIEPNFSTSSEMDFFWNFAAIYWKRRIARFWQDHQVLLFVDLYVSPQYRDLNLLSVPKGWTAYANRALRTQSDHLLDDYALACNHAGTDAILYLVFGGGPAAAALCKTHQWLWIENQRSPLT
ncbi:MAG: DUF4417 domain-containing protein [Deltaproteobacteria bacterium]|nr:DUF4417 domain-containing protein [Deltaproteobacteria bacterium]